MPSNDAFEQHRGKPPIPIPGLVNYCSRGRIGGALPERSAARFSRQTLDPALFDGAKKVLPCSGFVRLGALPRANDLVVLVSLTYCLDAPVKLVVAAPARQLRDFDPI